MTTERRFLVASDEDPEFREVLGAEALERMLGEKFDYRTAAAFMGMCVNKAILPKAKRRRKKKG